MVGCQLLLRNKMNCTETDDPNYPNLDPLPTGANVNSEGFAKGMFIPFKRLCKNENI